MNPQGAGPCSLFLWLALSRKGSKTTAAVAPAVNATALPPAGTLNYPAGVAVSVAPSGLIYVANTAPGAFVNIGVFRPNLTVANSTYDTSLQNPIGMFVDGAGDVWVLDAVGTLHL